MKGRRFLRRKSAVLFTAVISVAGACAPAFASTTLSWDPNPAEGVQGGPGTWNTSNTSWNNAGSPATWTNSHNDIALFGGINSGSVQITTSVTASALQIDLAGYTISASASGKLTLSSGVITANADVTLSAPLSAPAGLTKAGAGVLTLANSGTIAGNITLNQGTLSFTTDANLGGAGNDIVLAGGRLRYNGSPSLVLASGHSVIVDAVGGEIETPNAGLTLAANGQLSGSGTLTKLGPQTLLINASNTAFLGSIDVAAGTLQLQQGAAINGRPVRLSGGNLALHANQPTDFQSSLTVLADGALDVGQINQGGVSAQTHALGNASIAAGSTLTITSSNHDSLQVHDLALNGALALYRSGVVVSGALSGNGAVTFDLGSQAPELLTTGLIFAGGGAVTFSNPLSAVSGATGPVAGAIAGTLVNYTGTWKGGGDGASSAVVLRDGGRFTVTAGVHLNTTTADRTAIRPFTVIGDGATSTFELAQGFIADHSAGGTVADGFASLEVRDATLITYNSANLPVISKLDGFGGVHRAGNLSFSGTSGARWIVGTADQQYDGGISIGSSATFNLEKNLTHSGSVNHKFDGSFQMPNAGATLTKQGSGTLALAGDQGYAPGTAMQISAGSVQFNTDPGAGWYGGNYTRGADGNIASAPAPAGTLALGVGGEVSAATAEFAAPHARVDSIAIKSKGSVQMTGAAQTLLTHSLTIETGGQMVVGGGRLIIDYAAGESPATAIAGYIDDGQIISGFKNGLTVGYTEISDFLHISGNQTGTISGETVDASSLLVSAIRIGDANLDGLVNFADFQRLELGYGLANQGWERGDFNYDGMVDQADLKLLYDHLDSVTSLTQPAAVPEPGFLAYFGAFSAVFCRYRRYIRHRQPDPQNSPESF